MRPVRKNPAKSRPGFAFVVDGECEVWYLQMLKRNERSLNVNIEPKIPQRKNLHDQFEMVCNLAEDYTKVFWIIDFDCILSETKECETGKQTPLNLFKDYCTKLKSGKYKAKVVTIINNPCLEYWYLLHFESTSKYFENCEKLLKYLKKKPVLKDYKKNRDYYIKENNDIYLRLKPYINDAIINAKKIRAFNIDDPCQGVAEMYLFFEDEKIKKALNLQVDSSCHH